VLGVVEGEGGGFVDGNRACVGVGIGFLTTVEAKGFVSHVG